ncbi:RdgB/HAM1 family non-canonical purine NTP pyrophosphatase [Idiomarina seosinensis]|uniref:RdgB/HAM1 family non-canonical purine NTP pyrophosphatase n=1 Tax=Idiomarina seosinensis TaxID=281739 RepID=UPI00384D70D5
MNTNSREIVLATGNPGKVTELQAMLADQQATSGWHIRPQSEWQFEEAEEIGLTFVENALIKARHACQHTGLAAIADDSGLAVPALGGAPGVISARYAGPDCSDAENIEKLMRELKDVPASQRQATFHCVLVFLRHSTDPTPLICHGQWHGEILTAPSGNGGFGYDPIFWVPERQCSAAQLSPADKQDLSHRGKALKQLVSYFTAVTE